MICEALSCLIALVSLSLLTRTSLLGTEIAGSTASHNKSSTRSRRKKQGVIEKCGPMLLHPSRIVRRNAASLVCMSSRVLGDADSEVITNRLLQPYLQYKPTFESTHHLLACAKAPSLRKTESIMRPSETIQADFEISSKLAKSLSVPSQKSVEFVAKHDFNWCVLLIHFCNTSIPFVFTQRYSTSLLLSLLLYYSRYEPFHLVASKDQVLSAPIYSLGFASLQKGELFSSGLHI